MLPVRVQELPGQGFGAVASEVLRTVLAKRRHEGAHVDGRIAAAHAVEIDDGQLLVVHEELVRAHASVQQRLWRRREAAPALDQRIQQRADPLREPRLDGGELLDASAELGEVDLRGPELPALGGGAVQLDECAGSQAHQSARLLLAGEDEPLLHGLARQPLHENQVELRLEVQRLGRAPQLRLGGGLEERRQGRPGPACALGLGEDLSHDATHRRAPALVEQRAAHRRVVAQGGAAPGLRVPLLRGTRQAIQERCHALGIRGRLQTGDPAIAREQLHQHAELRKRQQGGRRGLLAFRAAKRREGGKPATGGPGLRFEAAQDLEARPAALLGALGSDGAQPRARAQLR